MKRITAFLVLIIMIVQQNLYAQAEDHTTNLVDVVCLKDGSQLVGTILRWELERGMEFRLATGAVVLLPKKEIGKVFQHSALDSVLQQQRLTTLNAPKPYAFREKGFYNALSVTFSPVYAGSLGMTYAFGYRFNRWLGVGVGSGFEIHDLSFPHHFTPLYAEARGFLFPKKITPYYAVKLGYGFALPSPDVFRDEMKGGIYFSPEAGLRFGSQKVNFFAGAAYVIQDASYALNPDADYFAKDVVSFRRVVARFGILF